MVRATAIAVDATDNIYIANSSWSNILVFSSSATGNVAPIGVFAGSPQAGITNLVGVGVDSAGDVFATTGPEMFEFSGGASGTVWPTWTWTIGAPFAGVAIDDAGNIYAVGTLNGQPDVNVYPPSGGLGGWQTISSTVWTGSQYRQIAVH
jgi:hypothetical protein